MNEYDSVYQGEVTTLAFGGNGIIRHEGMVVFIPFTAPGDIIKFRITKSKKGYAFGELVEVIHPSSQRITPKCPYFGRCGGCQLQHLNSAAQEGYKRLCVEDSLKRIGNLSIEKVPEVISKKPWEYRRKITLSLQVREETIEAGYIGVDNRSHIVVERCPIFVSDEDDVIRDLQQVLKKLTPPPHWDGKVSILKSNENSYLFHFQLSEFPAQFSAVIKESLLKYQKWSGVLATTATETLAFGDVHSFVDIEGLSFTFSPKAFMQNHPELSLDIYRQITQTAASLKPKRALDLYCGVGISSLLLAKEGITVTGVESNTEAVSLAEQNAKANHLSAIFLKASVEDVIRGLLAKSQPDLVIVNPPRTGLDSKVTQALLASSCKWIIYVSCMPPTLARDLRILSERFQLQSVQPYDMFPQTAHVETVVLLTKK